MNGRKAARKHTKRDPEFYSNIRKKRVSYPKNEGMFTSETGRQNANRRWDGAVPKSREERPGVGGED